MLPDEASPRSGPVHDRGRHARQHGALLCGNVAGGMVRLGQRSDADLAWETGLLRHLHREGMPVPVPIPTAGGRPFADGLVVMTHAEGGPPETEADRRRVADALRQWHRLTPARPQRPGWQRDRPVRSQAARRGSRDLSNPAPGPDSRDCCD
jgi:Phosphotransferase enzyme family